MNIGYKVVFNNMRSIGIRELTYDHLGKYDLPFPDKNNINRFNSFTFYRSLIEIIKRYDLDKVRIFKINVLGFVYPGEAEDTYLTHSIELVEEIDKNELKDCKEKLNRAYKNINLLEEKYDITNKESNINDDTSVNAYYPYAIGNRNNNIDYDLPYIVRYCKHLCNRRKLLKKKYKYYYKIKKYKIRNSRLKDYAYNEYIRNIGYNYALKCDPIVLQQYPEIYSKEFYDYEFESDKALCFINDEYLNKQLYCIGEQLAYVNANIKQIRKNNINIH